MGKKINLKDIQKKIRIAEEKENKGIYGRLCAEIDKKISKAAEEGEHNIRYRFGSSEEEKLIPRILREYAEFKPRQGFYEAHGTTPMDYDFHYIDFFM